MTTYKVEKKCVRQFFQSILLEGSGELRRQNYLLFRKFRHKKARKEPKTALVEESIGGVGYTLCGNGINRFENGFFWIVCFFWLLVKGIKFKRTVSSNN